LGRPMFVQFGSQMPIKPGGGCPTFGGFSGGKERLKLAGGVGSVSANLFRDEDGVRSGGGRRRQQQVTMSREGMFVVRDVGAKIRLL